MTATTYSGVAFLVLFLATLRLIACHGGADRTADFTRELYDTSEFSEAHEVAAQGTLMEEGTLPLDECFAERVQPSVARGRSTYEYHKGERRHALTVTLE